MYTIEKVYLENGNAFGWGGPCCFKFVFKLPGIELRIEHKKWGLNHILSYTEQLSKHVARPYAGTLAAGNSTCICGLIKQ